MFSRSLINVTVQKGATLPVIPITARYIIVIGSIKLFGGNAKLQVTDTDRYEIIAKQSNVVNRGRKMSPDTR